MLKRYVLFACNALWVIHARSAREAHLALIQEVIQTPGIPEEVREDELALLVGLLNTSYSWGYAQV